MKVLNLRCSQDHAFEGWFGSEDDFQDQSRRGVVQCPLCGDPAVTRLPSAPRLNLSGAREPTVPQTPAPSPVPPQAADLQAAWLSTVRELMARTEDVGDRFAEEARRIHYGEEEARGIRGSATPQEREALREEGIETLSIPVPTALKGPVQ